MTTLATRIEQFKTDGYTVFEGLHDETLMQAWRDGRDRPLPLATTLALRPSPRPRPPLLSSAMLSVRTPSSEWMLSSAMELPAGPVRTTLSLCTELL